MIKKKISLSNQGIKEFKELILNLSKNLNDACEQIEQDMAEHIITEITNNYSKSYYRDMEDSDTRTFKVNSDKKVIAGIKGKQVIYREFGTGTEGLNAPHPIKNEFALNDYNSGPTIRTNKYPESNASKNGIGTGELYWTYKNSKGEKVYTQGVPAGKEVYLATTSLKRKKNEIIKRRVGEALSKL